MATIKTKNLKGLEYQVTPLGIEIPVVENESPITAVREIKKVPKWERRSFARDLGEDKRQVIGDPEGFFKHKLKTDLLYLLNQGLGFKDVDYKCRVVYQKELADFLQIEGTRKWILLPRWHFKTTFTQGYIVQELLNNPNTTFMLRSNTWKWATSILDVIEKRIKSPIMKAFFGDLEGDKWSRDEMNLSTRTEFTREPNVFATGIGTDVTGLHPTKGVFDDVQSENNYETAEGRKMVRDDYEYCLFVVEDVVGLATRWNELDLSGHLIEKNKTFPFGHKKKYQMMVSGVYDKMGEPIFPVTYKTNPPSPMYDKQWIEDKRRELGAYKFSCQMLNEPIASEDQVFRDATLDHPSAGIQYFDRVEYQEILKKKTNTFILVDPAGSEEKYSDEWAIIVNKVDEDMRIYVVDYVLERMNLYKGLEKIWAMMNKWNPDITGIEKGILEKALKKPLKDYMKASKKYYRLRPLKYGEQPGSLGRNKTARIMSFVPYVENGLYFMGKWMYKAQEAMLRWRPYKNSKDDFPDGQSYILQVIYTPSEMRVIKSKTPFQRFLERKRAGYKDKDFETRFLNQEVFHV